MNVGFESDDLVVVVMGVRGCWEVGGGAMGRGGYKVRSTDAALVRERFGG